MLVVALPLTLVGLALATVCFALGVVAVATLVLAPLALVFASIVQASATARRAVLAAVVGVPLSPPNRPAVSSRRNPYVLVVAKLRSGRMWRDLGSHLTSLLAVVLSIGVATGTIALIVRAVVWPAYAVGNPSFYELAWGGPILAGAMAVHCVPGVVLLVAGPWLLRWLTRLCLLAAGVERDTGHPGSIGGTLSRASSTGL
ncbi:hypothetical protein BJD99_09575 [Rhodococcus sp. 1163]|nr:hypothetical protein BJD99_09575 [Rhodococcus sp. 1163]